MIFPNPLILILILTHVHTHVRVHVFFASGIVTGVDEESTFSWPVCSYCRGDHIAESADNPW